MNQKSRIVFLKQKIVNFYSSKTYEVEIGIKFKEKLNC